MKKIIGLVVILAVLVLGGYYGVGLLAERTIKQNVEVINQTNGLFVDIDHYKRGWYSSVAVLNWRIHIPEGLSKNKDGQTITTPAQDYSVQMPLKISHGPLIFTDSGLKFGLGYAHSDVVLPSIYAEKFSELFTNESTKPTLSFNLFVNYMNKSQFHIGLPTFKLVTREGGDQFEWYGMDSHIIVSSNLKDIEGGFVIDGMSFTKNKLKATLAKLATNYDFHQNSEGLYLGTASLSLPSFVMTEDGQNVFSLQQFAVSSHSDTEGGLFNTQFQTSLSKFRTYNKTYGPAVFEMSIKNLDAQVLSEINAQVNKVQQGTGSERQQALFAILPELPKLFGKGAQFEISKLNLAGPEGAIDGTLLVSLPKGDTGNPFQLLQKVTGHGVLKIPAVMLKGLVAASVKQRLISQQTVQTDMNPQLKDNDSSKMQAQDQAALAEAQAAQAQAQAGQAQAPASTETQGNQAQVATSQEQTKPMSIAEIGQEAVVQADQKVSNMLQVGLLTLKGSEYMIEVDLAQGQLSVNGKPFTPAMMQF